MSYQVKIEKVINKPVSDVFRALQEGRLFLNCGASIKTMELDFTVGGKYHIDFKNHGVYNFGEFLEIIPNKKIVFSWCQTFGQDQKPDTQVTIDLFEDGPTTRLVLVHTGFKTQENCDNHEKGWIGGATDLFSEMSEGRIRLVRRFQISSEKVFDLFKNHYFAEKVVEVIPLQKMVLACSSNGEATFYFKSIDNGQSSVELVHEGLANELELKKYRKIWELTIDELRS